MNRDITPGVVYWVEFARTRFKVRAEKQPLEPSGWWLCTVGTGEEIILPESAFREAADDG